MFAFVVVVVVDVVVVVVECLLLLCAVFVCGLASDTMCRGLGVGV